MPKIGLYLSSYDLTTDESVVGYPFTHGEHLPVVESNYKMNLENVGQLTNQFGEVSIRRSYFDQQISRSFMSIDDLFSFIGGFMQAMVVLFGYIIQ